MGLLKRMARISQDFYAGMAKRVIILRAPALFEFGWNNVVKHFFDPHIRDLIVFSNADNYLEVLDTFIDLRVLPACLAPGHGEGMAMPFYFRKVHLEGGLIPEETNYKAAVQHDINEEICEHVNKEQERLGKGSLSHHGINIGQTEPVGNRVSGGSLLRGYWDIRDSACNNEHMPTGIRITILRVS